MGRNYYITSSLGVNDLFTSKKTNSALDIINSYSLYMASKIKGFQESRENYIEFVGAA